MQNIFDFNPHEYLSCILYNDLYKVRPLNEIRGRIPFIEKNIAGDRAAITINVQFPPAEQ